MPASTPESPPNVLSSETTLPANQCFYESKTLLVTNLVGEAAVSWAVEVPHHTDGCRQRYQSQLCCWLTVILLGFHASPIAHLKMRAMIKETSLLQ